MSTTLAPPLDLSLVDAILERRREENGAVIPVLQQTQDAYGYLPREALERIAGFMGLPLSQVYGVATFYSQFYLARRGRNVVKVCDGTACHVRGAGHNIEGVQRDLGVGPGSTTQDYQFTFEVVYCLGACALGPVAVVNGEIKGKCGPDRLHRLIDDLR